MLEHLRMPLYFFLSGLFFKEYGGFIDFTIRKIDKLIIPCIFFSFIFVIPDLTLLHPEEADRIFTFSYWKEFIIYPKNTHLWFLRCLFCSSVLYYIFHTCTRKLHFTLQLILILTISYGMYNVSHYMLSHVNLNNTTGGNIIAWLSTLEVYKAFTVLPLFLIAHKIKTAQLLSISLSKVQSIFIFIASLLVWIITTNGKVSLIGNEIKNNLFLFYIAALGGIGCVWSIARWIKHIPLISYLGRYSLIILGIHNPFVTYGKMIDANPWITFGITIACMPPLIWFFKKYFPWFTAQRDFVYAWYRKIKTRNQISQ